MTGQPAPDLVSLLAMLAASDAPAVHESTPAQAREGLRALAVQLRGPEAAIGGVEVAEDQVAGMPARVYRPTAGSALPRMVAGADAGDSSGEGLPTVYFVHGGGFVIGDLDTHDPLCRLLARDGGAVVVAVDYPLAPEAPFPAGLEATLAGLREVHGRRVDFGGSDRIAVAGDSAGGNLCAVLAQQARDLGLSAQLLLYPAVDPLFAGASREENADGYFLDLASMEWFLAQYAGSAAEAVDLADPRIAPLHGDLADVAPALVVTAGFDPLRDEGEAYADALERAGVPVTRTRYDDQIHGFANLDHLASSSRAALADVIARFRTLLHPA